VAARYSIDKFVTVAAVESSPLPMADAPPRRREETGVRDCCCCCRRCCCCCCCCCVADSHASRASKHLSKHSVSSGGHPVPSWLSRTSRFMLFMLSSSLCRRWWLDDDGGGVDVVSVPRGEGGGQRESDAVPVGSHAMARTAAGSEAAAAAAWPLLLTLLLLFSISPLPHIMFLFFHLVWPVAVELPNRMSNLSLEQRQMMMLLCSHRRHRHRHCDCGCGGVAAAVVAVAVVEEGFGDRMLTGRPILAISFTSVIARCLSFPFLFSPPPACHDAMM
jgi:hypothetical protein